jgi:hypothetical protein
MNSVVAGRRMDGESSVPGTRGQAAAGCVIAYTPRQTLLSSPLNGRWHSTQLQAFSEQFNRRVEA